jgi:hypothetical protein
MTNEDPPVGYKRPPKAAQFKPGQSGNPSGKPKGLRSIAHELRDILSEEITVSSGNETKRVTKQRALASALVTAAIEGDLRATAIVMGHLNRDGSSSKEASEEDIDFSAINQHRKGG